MKHTSQGQQSVPLSLLLNIITSSVLRTVAAMFETPHPRCKKDVWSGWTPSKIVKVFKSPAKKQFDPEVFGEDTIGPLLFEEKNEKIL